MMDILIQGLVVGTMFGVLGLIVAVLRSKTEVARRIKIILGVIVAGMIVIMVYQTAKIQGVLILAGITAAAVWIYRGRKTD
jgi:hypothetical protein